MKYRAILADPPWQFSDQGTRMSPEYEGQQRAGMHYRTMSLQDVRQMCVAEVAEDDAFLFLWSPNSFVLNGWAQSVAESWGFTPKQLIPWLKTTKDGQPRIGGGHYTRVCTEMLILARRGKIKPKSRSVKGFLASPRGRHSAKPESQYELIQRLTDGPYLELFARQVQPGWDCWGNEVKSTVQLLLDEGRELRKNIDERVKTMHVL